MMRNNLYIRSTIALELLKQYPPSICDSLVSNPEFRHTLGIKADSHISFGTSGVSFQRSALFNCIREILADGGRQSTLKDASGDDWHLELAENENKRQAVLSKGDRKFFLPDFTTLSPDRSERLSGFELHVVEVNLPKSAVIYWREILSSRALTDGEWDSLNADINETPARVAAAIYSEIEVGTSNLSSLVPHSERYYDRLVGECKQSSSIAEYAQTGAAEHIRQLTYLNQKDGLLSALLLSAHSMLSQIICVDKYEKENVVKVYEFLQTSGDRISQIGAIEIGLYIVDKYPEIECYIKNIIEQIKDDNTDDDKSRFKLLSALIILADGELARTKILREKPPFWRRLASIAQASLIERCVVGFHADIASLTKWAMQQRGQEFYIQTMCDLRTEPRWHPDYVAPNQLKAEFIGRIVSAAQLNASKLGASILKDLLLGEGRQSLQAYMEFPYPFLPGPLEGGLESQNDPPAEIVKDIEERLSVEVLQPMSFVTLVNSALIFRMDSHHAQFAAKALRAVKYHIRQAGDKSILGSILRGLATVAAVTRSVELADEFRILVRRCRQEPGRDVSAEDALWLGLIAAAAHSDRRSWCQYVGEWITELAFQPLQQNELDRLYTHLELLCHIEPELWVTCGRAEAALSSVANR
jgi:hypothetical protein